jgi:hypothetical protein
VVQTAHTAVEQARAPALRRSASSQA